MLTKLGAITLALSLTGCGDELACSSTPAKDLVISIAKEQYENTMDLNKSEFSVKNIRTSQKTDYRSDCLADISYNYQMLDEVQKLDFYAATTKLTFGAPGEWNSRPIKYDLQLTDDKKLYAHVQGLTGDPLR